jgi:L-malate glycosyltransferase
VPVVESVQTIARGVPSRTAVRRESVVSHCRLVHVMYVVDRLYLQGGGEEALLRIVKTLPRDRFRVSLVTFGANPKAAEIVKESGAALHILPIKRVYDWDGFKTALQLRELMRSTEVDVVHTFFETSNTWGALVAKLSGVPVIIASRRDMGILRQAKHNLAYKLVNRFSDGFVAVSDGVRDFCIQTEGLDPKKIFTVHNGVDLAKIDRPNGVAALKAKIGLPDGAPVVATVANIRRVKGLDTLLQAAAIVKQDVPNVRFVLAGGCLEREHFNDLQSIVREAGMEENVIFLGHFSEVFALLKLTNVFCLLSRSEGFSNAILEAMASGLPCVATRVGGNAEAIDDGRNGFLLAPEDAAAAAQRLTVLLKNPAEARRIGAEARRTVEEKFTCEKMAGELAELYQTMLGSRKQN